MSPSKCISSNNTLIFAFIWQQDMVYQMLVMLRGQTWNFSDTCDMVRLHVGKLGLVKQYLDELKVVTKRYEETKNVMLYHVGRHPCCWTTMLVTFLLRKSQLKKCPSPCCIYEFSLEAVYQSFDVLVGALPRTSLSATFISCKVYLNVSPVFIERIWYSRIRTSL